MKRYFVTSSFETPLPYDFIYSKNKRYIHVIMCKVLEIFDEVDAVKVAVPQHISLHSNLVQADRYDDSFVMYANELLTKYQKYEQFNQEDVLKIWFRNYDGSLLDRSNIQVKLKLLLEY